MVFPPSLLPDPEDVGLDSSAAYVADTPQNIKDTTITHRRHRWHDVREIGSQTGPYSVDATNGLAAGGLMRIQFDHKPDVVVVSISGQTAATGRVRVYSGEEGGTAYRLGPTGKAVIPAPQNGIISIRNIGTTPTFGNVIALAGWDSMPAPDVMCGN